MSAAADHWNIPARSARCQSCQAELPPGSRVTTVLGLLPEAPRRHDLCATCGTSVSSTPDTFFWRRTVPDAVAHGPVVDYDLLRGILPTLLQREEDSYRRLAYLVGLVLIRKRHLRLKGFELQAGREVMRVVRSGESEEILLPAPHLSTEELASTREQLASLLALDPEQPELQA